MVGGTKNIIYSCATLKAEGQNANFGKRDPQIHLIAIKK